MSPTLPISSLSPTEGPPPPSRSLYAVVTLCWPFSSSTKQCALLLTEPDFRLRNRNGQIRVRFTGSSAEAVARAQVGIGQKVRLELLGAQWANISSSIRTPGKNVDGELVYRGKLSMQVEKEDGVAKIEVVPGDTPPQEEMAFDDSMSLAESPITVEKAEEVLPTGMYASPAFVKGVRLSGEWLLDSAYDPFSGLSVQHQRKRQRTSFGNVRNWRYTERTPTPETQSEAAGEMDNIEASSRIADDGMRPQLLVQSDMAPPTLPLLRTSSNVFADNLDQLGPSNGSTGPLTPKLHPVPSSSLPLPSPFPVDARSVHFDVASHQFQNSLPVALSANTSSAHRDLDTAPQAATQSRESHVHDLNDDYDEEHDFNEYGDDLLRKKAKETNYHIHPEYMSDTEEDDEMYTTQVARPHPPTQSDRNDPVPLQQGDSQVQERQTNLVSDSNKPIDFMLDASEMGIPQPAPFAISPPLRPRSRVEQEQVMNETYRSLFGFQESTPPSIMPQGARIDMPQPDATSATFTSYANQRASTTNLLDLEPISELPSVQTKTALSAADISHPADVIRLDLVDEGHQEVEEHMDDRQPQTTRATLSNPGLPHLGGGSETADPAPLRDLIGTSPELQLEASDTVFLEHPDAKDLQAVLEPSIPVSDDLQAAQYRDLSSLDTQDAETVGRWFNSTAGAEVPEPLHSFVSTTSIGTESMAPTEVPSFIRREDAQLERKQQTGVDQAVSQSDGGSSTNVKLNDEPDSKLIARSEPYHLSVPAPQYTADLGDGDDTATASKISTATVGPSIASPPADGTRNDFGFINEIDRLNILPIEQPVLNHKRPQHSANDTSARSLSSNADAVSQDTIQQGEQSSKSVVADDSHLKHVQHSVYSSPKPQTRTSRSQVKAKQQPSSLQAERTSIQPPAAAAAAAPLAEAKMEAATAEKMEEYKPSTVSAKQSNRKSLASRLSNVPNAISTWFSPRRSTRLRPHNEEHTTDAEGVKAEHNGAALAIQTDEGKDATKLATFSGLTTAFGYFTPLSNLSEKLNPSSQTYGGNGIDVLAVVTEDTKAPERAKRGPRDFFTILHIADQSPSEKDSVRVEVFRPWLAKLPVAVAGDVVLLRAFVVKSHERQPYLLSTDASAWCVWRYSNRPEEMIEANIGLARRTRAASFSGVREEVKGPPVELGDSERNRAKELRHWWLESKTEPPEPASPRSTKKTAAGRHKL